MGWAVVHPGYSYNICTRKTTNGYKLNYSSVQLEEMVDVVHYHHRLPPHILIGCQILHVVLHYFLLTNYAWMLCEGLYLHTILVSAFISESTLLVWLHLLGWGVPVLFIVPYTISRVCVPGSID
ncbi:Diuretic hormone 31 Receptor, partial [Carabus blaptoides fortunei]